MRLVSTDELAQHTTSESCWVVIRGHVYDVTRFHHPGGNDRLFELAGRDATRQFEQLGHSAAAERHMRSLLVGRLADSPEPPPSETLLAPESPQEPASGSSSQRVLKGGKVHRVARAGEPLWSTRCRGFLPVRDPPADVGEPYAVLQRLVAAMPVALVDGSFRRLVEAERARFELLAAAIDAEQSADVLERVHGLFGYVGRGYVHGTAAADGSCRVPRFLSDGWLRVSERVGRPPTVDYAGCVLYNWERLDPAGPMVPENLRLLNRFTGLLDEEWFMKTHVVIESEASGVVSAVYDCCAAVRTADVPRLLAMLAWLEQALSHVTANCLWLMFDRDGADGCLCEPELFYHRVRPHIGTWTALFDGLYEDAPADVARLAELRAQLAQLDGLAAAGRAHGLPDLAPHRAHLAAEVAALQRRRRLCGPSGAMSSILPLCDALLGVEMSSAELGAMLAAFEEYMPREHRALLARARREGARGFVLQLQAEGDEQAEALVDHFNAVVRRVLDFRWRHLSYVEEYVLRPSGSGGAAGTGGTPAFSYLNQHINDTEAALIRQHGERRSGDGADGAADADADAAGAPARPRGERRSGEGAADDAEGLWEVGEANGLLPTAPPAPWAALPPAWGAACELARLLPAGCVPPATYRRAVSARLGALPAGCAALGSAEARERARCVLAYVVAGWHAAGAPAEPPAPLRRLFDEASALVGRAPRLGLADLVLYNWRVDDAADDDGAGGGDDDRAGGAGGAAEGGGVDAPRSPALPAASARWPDVETMGRVRPLHRFLCLEEEEWFVRLHATLAAAAGGMVGAIARVLAADAAPGLGGGAEGAEAAAEGSEAAAAGALRLVRSLQQLEAAVEALVRVHHAAGVGAAPGAGAARARPALLMQRLHRFLPPAAGLGLAPADERAARVYCASGIDQACLAHLFGVARGAHALQRFREWQQADGGDLPAAHRAYLGTLAARTPLRERIERAVGVKRLAVQQLARLELAHNSCVDTVLRLFELRFELVRMLCGKDALKAAWEQERSSILDARLRLLVERREMVGPREGLPTSAQLYKRMPGERGV